MTTESTSPKPGRPRKLTRAMIRGAALQIIVEDGFGALGLRALAHRLKASPASLYNYIGHIEDIEREVLEDLIAQLPIPSREHSRPMRLQLIEHLVAVRWQQMIHPHFLHAPVGSTMWRLQMKATGQVVEALAGSDEKLIETVVAYNALIGFVGSSAERARTTGRHSYFEAESNALRNLRSDEFEIVHRILKRSSPTVKLGSLVSRLNYLIDRLLPDLDRATAQELGRLEKRLQPLIDGTRKYSLEREDSA